MKTRSVLEHVAVQIYGDLCTTVGSEYAKSSLENMEQNGLGSLARVDPSAYVDANVFMDDWMLQSYLSKYTGISDKRLLSEKARVDFLALEAKVSVMNTKLRSIVPDVEGVLSYARRKIEQILASGSRQSSQKGLVFPFQELYHNVEWGPGASATLPRAQAYPDKKMLEQGLSVTPKCLPYAQAYIQTDLQWLSARLGFQVEGPLSLLRTEWNVMSHDVFDTVDKSFKQRRVILKQPTVNVFFQKSLGKMIRRRLKRELIDLDDQSRNQRIARRAFRARYATIDLASASDSVSWELVSLLLPPSWFQVLTDLRTDYTKIGDSIHRLSKFSAMGNGFTFELESLIFYALSWAVVRQEQDDLLSRIAVYGDDIIVHQRHAVRLIEVLESLGFEVNRDKSFVAGNFFESCGKHYFKGHDVTPIYQKEEINSLSAGIRAHNRILRWCSRVTGGTGYDQRFRPIVERVRRTCEEFVKTLNENRYTSFLRLGRRRMGKRPKAFSPVTLPYQPGFVLGDGALISDPYGLDYQYDIHGVTRINFLRDVPVKIDADNWALLATALRRGEGRSSRRLFEDPPPFMGGKLDSRTSTVSTFRTERVYRVDYTVQAWVTLVK